VTVAIVLMGVSGCGKTSVGEYLADVLGWPFFDGDDFHPEENVVKMGHGVPLTDEDRIPWLEILNNLISRHLSSQDSILLACSALKQTYRDQLRDGNPGTVFVYLKGDFELIYGRMQARDDHYMKPEMLRSQFETLEAPTNALIVPIDQPVAAIGEEILRALNLPE
jgi:gluconokinase